jgi:hypothetical protein
LYDTQRRTQRTEGRTSGVPELKQSEFFLTEMN